MDHRFDNKTPSTQKILFFYDETVDSRLKFTKIDYARLMQGNYGIGRVYQQICETHHPYFRRW